MVTRAVRNHNPLNIEYRPQNQWAGLVDHRTDTRFCEFNSDFFGFRAGFIILRKYLAQKPLGYGCRNIAQVISMWAPPSENNTSHYIDFVANRAGISKTHPITFDDRDTLISIVQAMAQMESGKVYSTYVISLAYDAVTKR